MKLGKYKVDYFGEEMEVELVEREGLKQPVFIIDGELTPIDLVDSFEYISE